MKDGFFINLRAVVYSLLLHGILVLLMIFGLWWTTESRVVVLPGQVIEASLVGPTAAPKPAARWKRHPSPGVARWPRPPS